MDVAESQHHVRAAGRCDAQRVRQIELRDDHLLVELRVVAELAQKSAEAAALIGVGTVGIELCGVESAVVLQHRCENLRIPAAAGPDLHHRHVRGEAEKFQRLVGFAVDVPGAVGLAAVLAGDGIAQPFRGGVVERGLRGRGAEQRRRGERDPHAKIQSIHEQIPPWNGG